MKTPVKTMLVGLTLAMALWGLAACSDGDDEAAEGASQESATEPDLSGIPDVVATVNDREITKDAFVTAYESQFQQTLIQAQTTGEPVDQDQLKQQTAEGLVNNELLLEEAENRDFTASEDDVDAALTDFAEQSGVGSTEDYLSTLEEQGLGEDEVRSQLEVQVKIDQLLAEEVGDDEASEEELQELYDQAVAQQEQQPQVEGQEQQEIPPFDEVRPELEEQAASQKESAAAQTLIEGLRDDAEVEINLD